MYSQSPEFGEAAAWFQSVDTDRSGRITATELQQALTNADWSSFSYATCKLLINVFDASKTGTVGLPEFQGILRYTREWQATFARFDNDRSGFIDQNELQQALAVMRYNLSPQFGALLISIFDPKERRRISMDNFIYICVKLHIYTEAFKNMDREMKGSINLNYEAMLHMVVNTL